MSPIFDPAIFDPAIFDAGTPTEPETAPGATNPLRDGTLILAVGDYNIVDRAVDLEYGTAETVGDAFCDFRLPLEGTLVVSDVYPSVTTGALVELIHGTGPATYLFRGWVANDVGSGYLDERGSTWVDVHCTGRRALLDKRKDLGYINADRDTSKWRRHRQSNRKFATSNKGRLYICAEEGDSFKNAAKSYLCYWLGNGLSAQTIDHIKFTWETNLGAAGSAWHARFYTHSTLPLDPTTMTVHADWQIDGSGSEPQSGTNTRIPTSGSFTAGTKCIAFRVNCDSAVSNVGGDRYLDISKITVFTGSSETVTVDTAMVDVVGSFVDDTDTTTIGSALVNVFVEPPQSRSAIVDALAGLSDTPLDYGYKTVTGTGEVFYANERPTDVDTIRALNNAYAITGSTPGYFWNVRPDVEEGAQAVTITYRCLDDASYPDGTIRSLTVVEGGGAVADTMRVDLFDVSDELPAMNATLADALADTYLSRYGASRQSGTAVIKAANVNRAATYQGRASLTAVLELVDYGINAPSTSTVVDWDRSLEVFNVADYDGTVTCYFDAIVSGVSGVNIDLYDVTNAESVATITTDSTSIKRYRVAMTPNAGANTLKVRTPATASASLAVRAARIIVEQVDATKTRLSIPCFVTRGQGTASSANDNSVYIDQRTAITYGQTTSSRFGYWNYEAAAWDTVADFDFDAILASDNASGVAYAALHTGVGVTIGAGVSVSGVTVARATETIATASMPEGAVEVRIKSNNVSYNARILKARLYVNLSTASKGEVHWRIGETYTASADNDDATHRILLDSSDYSDPLLYHEATAYLATASDYNWHLKVGDAGTSDTATSYTDVSNSGINVNPNTSRMVLRSDGFTITDGDRFVSRIDYNGVNVTRVHAAVVVAWSATQTLINRAAQLAPYIRAGDYIEDLSVEGHTPQYITAARCKVESGEVTLEIGGPQSDLRWPKYKKPTISALEYWRRWTGHREDLP